MLFNSHTNVHFFGTAVNDGIERRKTMGFGRTACRFYDLFFDSPFRLRTFAHLSSTQMLCAQHPSDNDVRDGAIERECKINSAWVFCSKLISISPPRNRDAASLSLCVNFSQFVHAFEFCVSMSGPMDGTAEIVFELHSHRSSAFVRSFALPFNTFECSQQSQCPSQFQEIII